MYSSAPYVGTSLCLQFGVVRNLLRLNIFIVHSYAVVHTEIIKKTIELKIYEFITKVQFKLSFVSRNILIFVRKIISNITISRLFAIYFHINQTYIYVIILL